MPVATALLLVVLNSACSREVPENELAEFDAANFDRSTEVDNDWLPLAPGTFWVYEGTTTEDGETLAHRLEFTVTDLTKVIQGVRTTVAYIVDFREGEVVEEEIAFYAQDNEGDVWYLGEYPEEYEDGEFVEAPTWIAGLEEARAGIKMRAEPQLGTPRYFQGWGPAVDWSDFAQVDQIGQETCVPVDCYQDVLVIAESSLDEPDAFQLKYYARGVGEVRVGWRGADATQEQLELVEFTQLDPEALAQARDRALELEQHAYQISEDVYAQTSPVEYLGAGLAAADDQVSGSEGPALEVVVYTSELPRRALSEFEVWDDPASPGGKMVGTPNSGDELDPPPENDPHVEFDVQVRGGLPYRCWVHMKVGAPMGKSRANVLWVQLSDAVDQTNNEILRPGTGSYLTAQGPDQEGWAWVGCDLAEADPSQPLIYFRTGGEITVRLQAGMEGVGFDQFVLSPSRFLEGPPTEAIVEK
jgi:hypothetical protein